MTSFGELEENLERCTIHNCIFAIKQRGIKDGSILSETKLPLLKKVLSLYHENLPGPIRGLIAIQSHKQATALMTQLEDCPFPLEGVITYSDLFDLRTRIKSIVEASQTLKSSFLIVTTDNVLINFTSMGLLPISYLDFIIFDELLNANRRHPYCNFMDYFYAPLLLTNQPKQKVPKLMAFTAWPKVAAGESIRAKVDRKTKLRQYHHCFFSTIIPLVLEDQFLEGEEFINVQDFYSEHRPELQNLFSNLAVGNGSREEAILCELSKIGAKPHLSGADVNLLGNFYSTLDHLANRSFINENQSLTHMRINSTGAVIFPLVSPSLLLSICSRMSQVNKSGIRIRTYPIRRASEDLQKIYDKERVFFRTIVTLPAICVQAAPTFFENDDALLVHGPLATNRTWAINHAAFAAICKLHQAGLIDDNLLPIDSVCRDVDTMANQLDKMAKSNNDPNNQIVLNEITEIIPDDLQLTLAWKEKITPHRFYLYLLTYETRQREMTKKNPESLELPLDTLIHLSDLDFFSSSNSNRALGMLLKNTIPVEDLRKIRISAGPEFYLSCDLSFFQEIALSDDEMRLLTEFQSFFFSTLHIKSLEQTFTNTIEQEVDVNLDFTQATSLDHIPENKKTAYMIAYMHNQYTNPCLILDNILEKYQSFSTSSRTFSRIVLGEQVQRTPCTWQVDWETMSLVIDQKKYIKISDLQASIRDLEPEKIPPPPPPFMTSIEKHPQVVDLSLFVLRRVVLFAPHNGLMYRIKKTREDLNPNSPFESKAFPACNSYADYMKLRYNLEVQDMSASLLEVKRIENFADISEWFNKNFSKKSTSQRSSKTHKATVIPEFYLILPIPYSLIRIGMLFPRVFADLEKQLITRQFYKDSLSHMREYWPSIHYMAEALTGLSANVDYSYERLEIIGDAILKLFTTIDVFMSSFTLNEGQLSARRQERINNYNLSRVAHRIQIPYYARLTGFDCRLFFAPEIDCLFDKELEEKWPLLSQVFDGGLRKWRLITDIDQRSALRHALHYLTPSGLMIPSGETSQDPTQISFKQKGGSMSIITRFGRPVPPKTLADLVESLIASFYFGPGKLEGSMMFMQHAGILSQRMCNYRDFDPNTIFVSGIPTDTDGTTIAAVQEALPMQDVMLRPLVGVVQTSTVENVPPYVPSEAEFPFALLEELLDYKFRYPRLLFLAFTHRSVDITHNYERLEWVGDAAIDWIVMRYYYEGFPDENWMTPDRISLARQTAVCNETLGRIALMHGLHRYLRISSAPLQLEMERFAKIYFEHINSQIDDYAGESKQSTCPSTIKAKLPLAPKTLGDLLEALAGAVLLDLHFDIQKFERVFMPLLIPYLRDNVDPYDLPDNPVHELQHHLCVAGVRADAATYEYPPVSPGEDTKCILHIGGRVMGMGEGSTREVARIHAVRAGVQYIRSGGWLDLANFR